MNIHTAATVAQPAPVWDPTSLATTQAIATFGNDLRALGATDVKDEYHAGDNPHHFVNAVFAGTEQAMLAASLIKEHVSSPAGDPGMAFANVQLYTSPHLRCAPQTPTTQQVITALSQIPAVAGVSYSADQRAYSVITKNDGDTSRLTALLADRIGDARLVVNTVPVLDI